MRIRYSKIMICLILFVMTLTGCGSAKNDGTDATEDDGRTVITLGNLRQIDMDSYLYDLVDAFNRTDQQYRIEIIDYADREDRTTAFNMDVAVGKCPDILIIDRFSLDRVMHVGLLEDLKPYLEQDTELHPEDFLDNILEVCTDNGHMYYLGNAYYVNSMFGRKDQLADYENGWTREEMLQFANSIDNPLFYENDKLRTFDNFMLAGTAEFTDWDQQKAKFDSPLFQSILEYCNRGIKNSGRTEVDPQAVTEFKQGKCSLAIANINDFMSIEDTTRWYGEDLTYVGMPNPDRDISGIHFMVNIAISSQSEYKDVAWKFIKSLYTKETQYELSKSTLSVRKDIFAIQKQASMATEPYVDEMGGTQEPIDCETPNFRYTPLTQEEADLVERLVTSAKHCWKDDHGIENIVYEEVQAYFNGDCTIDRVGETINSRVETYMNENR